MPIIARWIIGGLAVGLFGAKAGEAMGEEAGKALPWLLGGAVALYVVTRGAK